MNLTPGRVRTARIVALAADCIQILAVPAFSPGVLSPINDILDVVVGAILIGLLGWHWAFLPAFIAEVVPVFDLIPTWSGTVFFVTRGVGEPPPAPPVSPPGRRAHRLAAVTVYSGRFPMWLVYLVALIVGGGVLLLQIASGFGHDLDHGIDHHPSGPGLLSTRAAMFGLLTFGMVGAPVHILGLLAPGGAFALAAGSGVGAAVLTGFAFRRLGHPSASGAASYQEARGMTARVIVACAPGRRGKVRLSLKGMVVDVMAVSQSEIPAGAVVRILDVQDDVARVEPAEEA